MPKWSIKYLPSIIWWAGDKKLTRDKENVMPNIQLKLSGRYYEGPIGKPYVPLGLNGLGKNCSKKSMDRAASLVPE